MPEADWHVRTYHAYQKAMRHSRGGPVGFVGFVCDAWGGYWQATVRGVPYTFQGA